MPTSVESTVARIENQVLNIQDDVREIKDLLLEQNGRVRQLEIESAKFKGGWTVLGIIGTVTGAMGGLAAKYFS